MQELIARVAQAAGIPADQAERVVNLVLAFLQKEAPKEFEDLHGQLPGAEAAAAAGATDKPQGGGLMGGMMSMIGGSTGGLMGLAAKLTAAGLSTGEMTSAGKEIFAFAREKAGDERVDEIAHAIPGLSQFI